MARKIKNTKDPIKKVESISVNDIESHLFNKSKMVVDFSFEGAFVSCKDGEFNNFLVDNKEFTRKFRAIMQDVYKLSGNTLYTLISNGGFRHCHKTKDEIKATGIIKRIFDIIGKTDDYEQVIECEEIFQIGLQSEIRLFGTIQGNIFRTYFVDYHHDFEFDERKNTRNKKLCKFCVINSDL